MSLPVIVEVPEELQPLLPTFLRNRALDVDALEAALAAHDLATIRQIGHNLKGVGGGYGFMQITEAGEALEALVQQQAFAGLADCIQHLRQFLQRVQVVYVSQ